MNCDCNGVSTNSRLQLNDGVCHKEYYSSDCCFDGGDCQGKYGICQNLNLQTISEICPSWHKIDNGICDPELQHDYDCCFDGADCYEV